MYPDRGIGRSAWFGWLPGSFAHIFNGVLLTTLFLGAVAVFEELPDPFPSHFSLSGAPDGWTDRSLAAWLILPAVAAACTALFYAAAWFIGRRPESMNMLDQKRFDALNRDGKVRVGFVVQRSLCWMSVSINTLFLAIVVGTYHVAVGLSEVLPWWTRLTLLLVVVGSPAGIVALLLRISKVMSGLEADRPDPQSERS